MPDITLGTIPGGSQNLKGYTARPSGEGPWPALVVLHEAWGMDDVMRRQCDRLASVGYLAFAPNLFSDGGALRCLITTFKAINSGKGKAFGDLAAARQLLLDDPDCTGKVGVIGFCMGGAFALVASTHGFDVASDNYGGLPTVLDGRFENACPIIASYGGKDRLLPRDTTAKLEKVLTAAGVEHDVRAYPGAGHQFLNDAKNGPIVLRPLLKVTNAGPDPVAAAEAWERIEAYLAKYLR